MSVEWNGDGAEKHVRSKAARALSRAAITIRKRAAELLSVPGTGREKGKQIGPVVRSKPGEPPHKQTGRLRASVAYEVDDASLTARVGTNVEYGKHLELGTKRGLKPRPWLRRAALEVRGKVGQLLIGSND